MKKVTYKITKISCTNCVKTITNTLDNYFGDDVKVNININNKKAYITYDENKVSENEIKKVLKNSGYPVDTDNTLESEKRELILSIVLSIPLVIGMFGHLPITQEYIPKIFTNPYLQLVLATIIEFYIGRRFFISAYKGIKSKVLGMDFLVSLGSLSAYIYSVIIIVLNFGSVHQELYFEISALVITIVLIGKYIESKMQKKTTDVVDALLELNPKKAHRLTGDKIEEIDYSSIKENDILISYAGSNIPADGIVTKGRTYVNESSFTGESKPVIKEVGDSVIGGSINENSTVELKVVATGDKSVLNQIITSIEEATIEDTRFQRIADKAANIFVPFIVLVALSTFIITYLVVGDLSTAITNSLAVILISCPCALGLATPTSIMVSNQIASRHGLLYKSPKFFELADKIDVIAFDKTGTLTKGIPTVKDFDVNEEDVDLLYAVESQSKHPISKQVVNYLEGKVGEKIEVENYKAIVGFGIEAEYKGKKIVVANYNYMKEKNMDFTSYEDKISSALNKGVTLSILAVDNKVVGYYTVDDEIKADVNSVIDKLRSFGIETVMITGDNEVVANKVAKAVGIDTVYAGVLPTGKSSILKEYKDKGKIVAMIGDGINDSVALKVADVGISVKDASDIASLASDVILMKNDLNLIVDGIIISKRTNRNIKQNFMWAFSYNIIAIPLAATGNISMILATIAMSFSSIIVVLNALRLKRDKEIAKL